MRETSERVFMNTLIKHTVIALLLIVPIIVIGAFTQDNDKQPMASLTVDSVDLSKY